ncbi:MAG: type II secretion system protein GspG [Sandaracinaceae bacterium]|nr:type II secretion system protein GspG [Sandaracinaceae bacterium]
MANRRRRPSIALPWERQGAWLRTLLAGRRWRLALVAAVIVAAVVSMASAADERQRTRETRAAIAEIKRSIATFRADFGRCPQSLHELLHPPESRRRYLRHVPVDGWGRAFWVECPGRYDPDDADVVSAGPSGDFLNDDNLR